MAKKKAAAKTAKPEVKASAKVVTIDSDDVVAIQTALNRWDCLGSERITGVFDIFTEQALQAFQAGQNLPATGQLDEKTLEALSQ